MTTCRICFQRALNKHCPKCKLHSCETCYKLHLKECSILMEFKYHLCKQHESQLAGYCCQCCQMTCDLCHYDHAGHDIISTKLAAESIRSHLEEFSRSMHDQEVQLDSLKDIKGIKCCMVNKIEREEKKWLSFVSEIKNRLISKIEQDLKQHDYELQLHELLNEAKDNLDYLKKNSFTYIFLSKWLHVRSDTDLFEKLILQQLERNSRFEKQTTSDFSQIFRGHMVEKAKDQEIQYLQEEKTKLTDLTNKLHEEMSLKDQKLNDQREKVQKLEQFIRERLTCLQEETERTVLKLNKTEVERDELKQRVENLIDMMTDQKKKESTLQKENESMRNKITDFKIEWNKLTSINSRMSSIVNDGDTISDIEKENDTFKPNLKKLQRDKSKLEQEPSITLNKITESRENCQERSRRYVKESNEMEINMIVEACSDDETQFSIICHTSEEAVADSTLSCNGQENPHTTLAVSSSNELGYRQISSEKNIVQITANKVYMIERSTVSIESAIDVSNSIEDFDNNHLAIDD